MVEDIMQLMPDMGFGFMNMDTIIILVFFIFLAILVIFSIWKFKIHKRFQKYPLKVLILQLRQGNLFWTTDKGRRVTTKMGTDRYEFLHNNPSRPFSYKDLIIGPKGKHLLLAFSPEDGVIEPMKFNFGNPSPEIKRSEIDVRFWKTVADKEARIRWDVRGFWEKYGYIITPLMFTIAFFVMALAIHEFVIVPSYGAMSGTLQQISKQAEINREATQALTDAVNALLGRSTSTGGTVTVTPQPPPH